MTVKELHESIMKMHPNDWNKQLRVVFHGNDEHSVSWNKPVSAMREGPNFDFQFVVEGERK